MGNGSYRMNYNLYADPGYSNIWGDATTSAPTSQLLTGIGGVGVGDRLPSCRAARTPWPS